ncbi:DISARM system phospholipase D-like protein DrmC [Glycomyces sp. L485]|uniref:DISARM system phospholipase D-like protein DrmC n=1 Tax=Glycomyces sp. L485 TaxID=2909235 RepID=UPI001F4BA188|nr:DISARM system phospholipase D-like protein DrmC [Glycomyces sp. L485]MCH7231596.1 DISARM system phospholipase D-like protein DrmC [Glycomyces sp. L485]
MGLSDRQALAASAGRVRELIGPAALAACAADIVSGTEPAIIAARIGRPEAAQAIAKLATAANTWGPGRAEAYLYGLCDAAQERNQAAEIVLTGPTERNVPFRTTLSALVHVIDTSRQELWLSTYSARPHRPLLEALTRALDRNVAVSIAVETLAGAGSAIAGSEPAHAFAELDGARLYSWPARTRPEDAKLHAKLALADGDILLVTSANFTASGLTNNLEAGVLLTGGPGPTRAAAYLRSLVRHGTLERI